MPWLQLAGVEVENAKVTANAAFGDSITEGAGTGVDVDERWPDMLAQRLQADPRAPNLSIINAGIGGNRLLTDGNSPGGLARLDRDVLAHPGVTTLIVLIGVNDIGNLSREGPVTPQTADPRSPAVTAPKTYPGWAAIQMVQAGPLPACVAVVSAKGLAKKPDDLHLTTAAQRELGPPLAQAMDRLRRAGCR